ncbi:MAG: hypothetical protein OXI87_16985 [Albidovulum sp.]|nr:hypothetical protein [Albidovulum sp.]MDE0531189.1 hypothetical protein [Albidovulum sp.]
MALVLDMDEDIGCHRFGAVRIIGRWGIGKTELLIEARRRGGPDVPV